MQIVWWCKYDNDHYLLFILGEFICIYFFLNNFSPKTCFRLFFINQMDRDKDYLLELLVSRYIDIMSVVACHGFVKRFIHFMTSP